MQDAAQPRSFSLGLAAVLGLALAACAPLPGEPGYVAEADTQMCGTTVLEGVDVYNGTGAVDWSALQASGRAFAFMKASQGNYDTDGRFAANWVASKAAGIVRSPYHFFDGTIDGVTQADFFLNILSENGGLEATDLPPMLDIECPTSSSESAANPMCVGSGAGDSGWVDTATLQQRIFDWLDTVETATGRKAIVYSYVSWFASTGITDSMMADYPLYIASYNPCATVPSPWTSAVFWQYSATGSAPGITGHADLDRFFGSAADLQQLIGADEATDASITDSASNDDFAPPQEGADLSRGGGVRGGCQCDVGAGRGSSPLSSSAWLLVLAALVAWRATQRWNQRVKRNSASQATPCASSWTKPVSSTSRSRQWQP